MSERPAVTVVMPFAGGPAEAEQALAALRAIDRRPGDRLVLVDNNPTAVTAPQCDVEVIHATRERSSYYARNAGARAADTEWLLFVDADCRPDRCLIDSYFEPAPGPGVGALAGAVRAEPGQEALLARYSRSRGYLSQQELLADPYRPHAVTANLLVRRQAWASVGGFAEGVRSGGDSDFCWRLADAGWTIEGRPWAAVAHAHRERLAPFLRVAARYAAGRAWLRRRHPGSFQARPGIAAALRAAASSARWLAAGEHERAAFRALDAAVGVADAVGEQLGNRALRDTGHAVDLVVLTDQFPALSETFVLTEIAALSAGGHRVRVEAMRRPGRQELTHTVPVRYLEDDSRLEKLAALSWLLARHPVRSLRDRIGARGWRREETVLPLAGIAPLARRLAREPRAVLHCHFAAGAALTTLRVARLLGRPYALTAHAYEIFREPRNLVEKLSSAEVVSTGCAYNVQHLRALAPCARIHEIVMGVDAERFRRRAPHPGGRTVIAVGRLVEKKGFADLVTALALIDAELVLVGDGPLRSELERLARELGVGDRITMPGAVAHGRVRELLEAADVLAMPCVIAEDGDRDSMPVVVKEAMALELPIVATREVGLPELVRQPFGRLVPAHDPSALAGALSELLALDLSERARLGAAARSHVLVHANPAREAAKLAALLGLSEHEHAMADRGAHRGCDLDQVLDHVERGVPDAPALVAQAHADAVEVGRGEPAA